jgi:YD repeat-containing protein
MGNELPRPTSNQSDASITNKISAGEKSPMSDRENAGLRGPVQQCTEEQTENIPARTHFSTTKYSVDGRLLQLMTSNSVEPSLQFTSTFFYDSAGRLLKITMTNAGSPAVESKYNYDDKQRLISITGNPAQTFTFQYDDQGRKARVLRPQLQLDSPLFVTAAVSIQAIEGEDPYSTSLRRTSENFI